MNFAPRDFDLLFYSGTHVGRGHHCAEPARCRDRLQTRDAHAHDEDLCGGYGSSGRHHHREGTAKSLSRLDHRAVACKIGLRGQNIHHLRAGDARHQLHRERRNTGIGHGFQRGVVAIRIHDGDDECAALVTGEFGGLGAPDLDDDIGVLRGASGDDGSCSFVFAVGYTRSDASSRFDRHLRAKHLEFLDGVRNGGDARLACIDLFGNCNFHDASPRPPCTAFLKFLNPCGQCRKGNSRNPEAASVRRFRLSRRFRSPLAELARSGFKFRAGRALQIAGPTAGERDVLRREKLPSK